MYLDRLCYINLLYFRIFNSFFQVDNSKVCDQHFFKRVEPKFFENSSECSVFRFTSMRDFLTDLLINYLKEY